MVMEYHTYMFVLCLITLCCLDFAAADVPVGSALAASPGSSPWLSSSGDFAFGFKQLGGQDSFLLSIWLDKIPEKTVVWYANGDNPAPDGSKLELTAQRGLVLRSPQGNEIWRSVISSKNVSYALMNDTGNFLLVSSNSGSLWQSFDHPTDTLLPGQNVHLGGMLFSRRSETNFSQGRFQLRFLPDGNLVFNSINPITDMVYDIYNSTGTADPANSTNSGFLVNFTVAGALYVRIKNGSRRFLTTATIPDSGFYQRVTLSFDGVLSQYTYPRTSAGNWSAFWSTPDNMCVAINGTLGGGVCGYNSICSLNSIRRPVCACPPGYSLLDPNDEFGSCKPDFEPSCERSSEEYGIVDLKDTDWPTSDYEKYEPFSESKCKRSCLSDCFCAAAVFKGNSCWLKKLPLSNGRVDNSVNGTAFLKTKNGNYPHRKSRRTLILSTMLGSFVFINVVLIVAFCLSFFFIYRKRVVQIHQLKSRQETSVPFFTFKELVKATNGFKEELGRGAFGVVYKGSMQIGSINVVAVKELDSLVEGGEKEFRTEVNAIGKTHHKNLVQFLGFCDEGQHRLLVYEYVSNGTLSGILFGPSKPSWKFRTQIAVGVARGLQYLHEECITPIIHCDIKPQNILLDENCNARISDFGFAKLLMIDRSETNTTIRGTRGYIAPEWFRGATITVKVDVYSFGVVLLETICCRRCVNTQIDGIGEERDLIEWVYGCYLEGTLQILVEDEDEVLRNPWELERFVKVAIWCIQEDPALRPPMKIVTEMLDGVVDVPPPPKLHLFSFDPDTDT